MHAFSSQKKIQIKNSKIHYYKLILILEKTNFLNKHPIVPKLKNLFIKNDKIIYFLIYFFLIFVLVRIIKNKQKLFNFKKQLREQLDLIRISQFSKKVQEQM